MTEFPIASLKDRVFTSRERVGFSHLDPNGHLNAVRAIEFATNHRGMAVEDQIKWSLVKLAMEKGLTFFMSDIQTNFVAPARLHEWLEIASWASEIEKDRFKLKALLLNAESKKIRATFNIGFVCINIKTGRPCPLPEMLESDSDVDLVPERPLVQDYLASLKINTAGVL
jgi:YbgC/YbaW family acyl-CoA thioester hydrolase